MSIDETFVGAFSTCCEFESCIVNIEKEPLQKTVNKKTIMILKSVNEARTDPFEMMITVMSSLMMKMIMVMIVMQLLNLNSI